MKKTYHYSFLAAIGLALCAGLWSCKDDDLASDSHYKPPVFLKGNAYEVLQKDGDYTIFLKGIELSDYKEIVDGKSILTVVAPNDNAFREFLAEKGYQSIEDLDAQDHAYLNKLIGYHLMYYAFNWDKMVNFRPSDGDGATEEDKAIGAGYYYKHRTHCSDPIEQARVKLTPNATTDTLINIYHYERYLPVFSNLLFATKGIDAAYNYNYFYPGTEWNAVGTNGSFNIANAKVLDEENVITDNGYLYHVDHVIEPLNTIYGELKENSNYSKFLSIYDSYSEYELADEETMTSLGYQAYLHGHGSTLPPIAWEWPSKKNSAMSNIAQLERDGYNVFAPTNNAIDKFFNDFWTAQGGYATIDDLDPLILQYFVMQSFSESNFIVFPEEITKGNVLTVYGTQININPEQVTDRKICCNGTLYGMDRMEMPAIFSSVVGPAFADTTYRSYLYALEGSSTLLSLASKTTKFVTLMPSNEQLYNSDPSIRLYTTAEGKELQQYSFLDAAYVKMNESGMRGIAEMHIAPNVEKLASTGVQVVSTNSSYNYWFVKDGKITTNALFNQLLEPAYTGDPFVGLHRLTNNGAAWDNGNSYSYDANAIFETSGGDGLGHYIAVCNDKNYPYYMFAQLLKKAGLVVGTELSPVLAPGNGEHFAVFVPTNDVIAAHIKDIPGCSGLTVTDGTLSSANLSDANKALLVNYLSKYFFSTLMNTNFSDYPYVGSSCNGVFLSAGGDRIRVTDTGSSLSVGLAESTTTVNVIADYDYLPFAYHDGCMHFIDGLLQ